MTVFKKGIALAAMLSFAAVLSIGCSDSTGPVTHTVTFDSQGGTEVSPQEVKDGDFIAWEVPSRGDDFFMGWFLNPEFTEKWDPSNMVTQDITLFARFENPENVRAVTFYTDGGSEIEPVLAVVGQPISAPSDPVKDGYIFEGWYTEQGDLWSFEKPVTEDMTLVAGWASGMIVFEDFNSESITQTTLAEGSVNGGYWYYYSDPTNDSAHAWFESPDMEAMIGPLGAHGAFGDNGLFAKAFFNPTPEVEYPYAAVVAPIISTEGEEYYFDLSNLEEIKFWAKGSGEVRVNLLTYLTTLGDYEDDWGVFGYNVILTPDWQEVTVPMSGLTPTKHSVLESDNMTWADASDRVNGVEFSFNNTYPEVELYLDNIRFYFNGQGAADEFKAAVDSKLEMWVEE
ncbi:putative cell wall-binding domain [Chitinispirillum alkaliphilum]|nr:putative cell wall-binding domain [Chitinispirillum alkaliphilum]